MVSQTVIIISFTLVGLACGLAIFLANRFLPKEDKLLKRAEDISKYFPGMNCGACGVPGCFAYSQELAKDDKFLEKSPCMRIMNDEDRMKGLSEYLKIEISPGTSRKVVAINCTGESETIYDYTGIDS